MAFYIIYDDFDFNYGFFSYENLLSFGMIANLIRRILRDIAEHGIFMRLEPSKEGDFDPDFHH